MGLHTNFEVKENVLIVRLQGEIDHHEAKQLREEWQDHMTLHNIQHVIVNVEKVSFMDSSGIGVLLGRYKEVAQVGGEMVICSITEPIKRIFDLSGLFKIIRLQEDEEDALSTLGVAAS
ncbi:MAG TPA: anti-sigma F factor antagonist [Bacillota bacterium]|nr:anti-sigma F factor antagonist [Bacillota bacterium]